MSGGASGGSASPTLRANGGNGILATIGSRKLGRYSGFWSGCNWAAALRALGPRNFHTSAPSSSVPLRPTAQTAAFSITRGFTRLACCCAPSRMMPWLRPSLATVYSICLIGSWLSFGAKRFSSSRVMRCLSAPCPGFDWMA